MIPSSQTKIAPQPQKGVENDVTFEILLGTGAMLAGRAREWGMVLHGILWPKENPEK